MDNTINLRDRVIAAFSALSVSAFLFAAAIIPAMPSATSGVFA